MTSDHLRVISQKVEQIWREVLGVAEGQEEATFFELEGQSISAVRIAARVEDEVGVQVDIGDLFEDPDLATFVRDVMAKVDSVESDERRSA